MKYLFTTVTFQVNSFHIETILDMLFAIKQECKIYAAGRIGTTIAGIQSGVKYTYSTGYKYGSLSINETRNGVKYSLLIFSTKKAKLSMGFPEDNNSYSEYINAQVEYYSSLCKSSYSQLTVRNITVQKEVKKIPTPKLKENLVKSALFYKVVIPEYEIRTRPAFRCYLKQGSNCHVAIDHTGSYQILGAKSEEDINVSEEKINSIVSDIMLDDLLG